MVSKEKSGNDSLQHAKEVTEVAVTTGLSIEIGKQR